MTAAGKIGLYAVDRAITYSWEVSAPVCCELNRFDNGRLFHIQRIHPRNLYEYVLVNIVHGFILMAL